MPEHRSSDAHQGLVNNMVAKRPGTFLQHDLGEPRACHISADQHENALRSNKTHHSMHNKAHHLMLNKFMMAVRFYSDYVSLQVER